jgi:PKD repeat protein
MTGATGTQAYAATLSGSVFWGDIVATFKAPPAPRTPQQVQEVGGIETAQSTNLTANITTTAGDLIVVTATLRGVKTFASTPMGDSAGNTYMAIATDATGSNVTGMFYAADAKAVTSVTVQASAAATIAFSVQEFSGLNPTSPLDVKVGATGTSNAPSSGTSPTTAKSTELVVAGIGWNDQATISGQSQGYTINPTHRSTPLAQNDVQTAYMVTTATGTQAYAATLNASVFWGDILATFTAPTKPAPPVAALTVTPPAGAAPLTVTANASGSAPGSSPIASYRFNFGDGNTRSPQSTPTATATYDDNGVFTVTVTVTDTSGLTSTATASVTVEAPVPVLTVSTPSAAPWTVTVNASASSDPNFTIVSYRFDFGDGTTAVFQAGAITTHTYQNPGQYTVTLSTTDSAGSTASTADIVTADSPPSAGLDVSTTSGAAPVTVIADASASSAGSTPIFAYEFNFGDGTNADCPFGSSCSHSYDSAGMFTVSVTVADALGQASTASATVTVSGPAVDQGFGVVLQQSALSQATQLCASTASGVSNSQGVPIASYVDPADNNVNGVYPCGPGNVTLPNSNGGTTTQVSNWQCVEYSLRYLQYVLQNPDVNFAADGAQFAANAVPEGYTLYPPVGSPGAVSNAGIPYVSTVVNQSTSNLPTTGDIISMAPTSVAGEGYGHTAVVLRSSVDTNSADKTYGSGSIEVVQQNWVTDDSTGAIAGSGEITITNWNLSYDGYTQFNWIDTGGQPSSGGGGSAPTGDDATPYSFWRGDGNNDLWFQVGPDGPDVNLTRDDNMASDPYPVYSGAVGDADTVDVFWEGADGNLWDVYCTGGPPSCSNLASWHEEDHGGGPLDSAPHPVSTGGGDIDVFWRGTDNGLWYMSYVTGAGWSGPEPLTPNHNTMASDPEPVFSGDQPNGNPTVDVFWRGTDGDLYHVWNNGSGWLGPDPLQYGELSSAPHPVSTGGNAEDVFWEGTDDNLHFASYNNGWTTSAQQLTTSGNLASDPFPVFSGGSTVDVYWEGADGALWHVWNTGSGWHPAQRLGYAPLSGPPVAASVGDTSIVVQWLGNMEVQGIPGLGIWSATYSDGWSSSASYYGGFQMDSQPHSIFMDACPTCGATG